MWQTYTCLGNPAQRSLSEFHKVFRKSWVRKLFIGHERRASQACGSGYTQSIGSNRLCPGAAGNRSLAGPPFLRCNHAKGLDAYPSPSQSNNHCFKSFAYNSGGIWHHKSIRVTVRLVFLCRDLLYTSTRELLVKAKTISVCLTALHRDCIKPHKRCPTKASDLTYPSRLCSSLPF